MRLKRILSPKNLTVTAMSLLMALTALNIPLWSASAYETDTTRYIAQQTDAPPQISLTVYNEGTALVIDRRTFELQQGLNEINFTDVAAQIDPTSVNFKSLTDPNTFVVEQNYRYDLVGSSALLQRYIDEQIRVITADGTTYEGRLLNGSSEIILMTEAGEVVVVNYQNIRDIQFPELPDGLITRPTLVWLVESSVAGPQEVEVTYLTGGVSWQADYNVVLNSDETALDLTGWVTLNNTSGATFTDAQLKLVAGDLNRVYVEQAAGQAYGYDEAAPYPTTTPPVEQRDFFEYKLYEVARRVTIQNNETKQIEFVSGQAVAATKFYVFDALANTYYYDYVYYGGPVTDQTYGQATDVSIQTYVEFNTGEEGLNADMPAGRVRLFKKDTDGSALLIGEDYVEHTPKGETVQLYVGDAFDLVGERLQTNFEYTGYYELDESYSIKLRNRKEDQSVEIRVVERLFRWSEWEITTSNMEYTKTSAFTIEYLVVVNPGEEVQLDYTVHYEWE
jgi:hypothetical protein